MTRHVLVGVAILGAACSGRDGPLPDGPRADARPDVIAPDRPGDRAVEARGDARGDAHRDGPPRDAPREGPATDVRSGEGPARDTRLEGPAKDVKAEGPAKDASVDSASCPGVGTALIGPSGGTLYSADCKARLAVPPGALATAAQLTMTPTTPPPGAVTVAYDIGPTGLVFTTPAMLFLPYAPATLSGATESKLTIGSVTASEWSPMSGAANQTTHEISAPLAHLSTYGGIPGDASGPVAKVIPLGPAGGAAVGENGGQTPMVGAPINASGFPLQGKTATYQVSNSTLATITPQGLLTALSLGFPPVPASVTVTATVDGISGSLPVLVVLKPLPTVVVSGNYLVQGRTGAPVGSVQLTHLQNPSTSMTIGASGAFTALPPLPAGSFYTIKLEKAGYLPTHHTWWSPIVDTAAASRSYPLYDASDVASLACSTTVDPAKGHVLISQAPPSGPAAGWEYSVSSPGATVRYLASAGTVDCAAQVSATGAALVLNVDPGYHWVMGKKGTLVLGTIIFVASGSSVTLLTFS
jgi:hypothetical protein